MIKTLTQEQKDAMPKFRDKWISIGLSTEKTNHEEVLKWVPKWYEAGGLKPPKTVIFCKSPYVSALSTSIAYSILTNKNLAVDLAVRSAVDSAVDSDVRLAVRLAVRSAVDSAVRSAVGSVVGSAVRSAVHSAVDSAVGSAVGSVVGSAVRSAVYSAVRSDVGSAVRSAVHSAVDSAVRSAVRSDVGIENIFWTDYCGGNLWAGWQAYYDYMFFIGVKACERLIPTFELSKQCGHIIPYKNYCFVTEKPKHIHLNNNRLHCETGSAIEWHDGYALYYLNGIRVPDWLITTPKDKIDKTKILKMDNTEQRQVAMRFVGYDQFEKELKAKVIDKKDEYKLMTFEFEGRRVGPYLKMKDSSSSRVFVEGVGDPVESGLNKKIKTVDDALKWRAEKAAGVLLTKLGYKLEINKNLQEA